MTEINLDHADARARVDFKQLTCVVCGSSFFRKNHYKSYKSPCCSKTCQGNRRKQATEKNRAQRFWKRVAKGSSNECWMWLGYIERRGYGQFAWSTDKPMPAHRASYLLAHQLDRIDPMFQVCHSCDVRACVNPSHLWLGTAKENVLDMHQKGRANPVRGEQQPTAKLTAQQVKAIRADKRVQRVIAADYGVNQVTISVIKRGATWRHVI